MGQIRHAAGCGRSSLGLCGPHPRANAILAAPFIPVLCQKQLDPDGAAGPNPGLSRAGPRFCWGLVRFCFFSSGTTLSDFDRRWNLYSEWARHKCFDNFSNPLWLGLIGELISPGKGVLLYCPILLLACLGARSFLTRKNKIGVLVACATLFYLLFFAKYKAWHGDNAWGPRYLTSMMPFWMLASGTSG